MIAVMTLLGCVERSRCAADSAGRSPRSLVAEFRARTRVRGRGPTRGQTGDQPGC